VNKRMTATEAWEWRIADPARCIHHGMSLRDDAIARITELEAENKRLDGNYRDERRLRQAADSALAQALRHPNSKLDHVTGYLYRLEHQAERRQP